MERVGRPGDRRWEHGAHCRDKVGTACDTILAPHELDLSSQLTGWIFF